MKTIGKLCLVLSGCALAAEASAGTTLPLPDAVARPKAEAILAKMTLDQKVSLLGGVATMYLKAYPELGIPREWAMSDCSHAVKPEHGREDWPYVQGVDDRSVPLPPLSSVAMSWNRDLAATHGHVMAEQMRALGKDQLLGPGVNIVRTPLCGRNWEYMSEDPYFNAHLVLPYIRAVQSHGVATTVKHFCLNNQELNRTGMDSVVDERTLNEIYLPAFEGAVREGGSLSLMTSYNKVRGVHASENSYLQLGIVRDRWGFEGMIVTDWGGAHSTVPGALNGGNVEMDRGRSITHFTDHFNNRLPLADAVRAGEVPEATVDEMALRVLYVMAKTGFLDGVQDRGERLTERHHRLCREIGEEAVALMRNEKGTLPLSRGKIRRLVVLGMQSDMKVCNGGSSCDAHADYEITPFEGLKEYLGKDAAVELWPLGAEAGADGAGAEIPNANILTEKPDGGEAFVVHAWEVREWLEGQPRWGTNTTVTGYAAKPAGKKAEALRYHARVRVAETGAHQFLLVPKAPLRGATVWVDGARVFILEPDDSTPGKQRETRSGIELAKDQEIDVTVDVAGCPGEAAFDFGWLTPSRLAGTAERKYAACRDADAVIVFTGTTIGIGPARESEGGDLPDMRTPAGHDAEIAKILGMGFRNLVVVNRSATPLELPWAESCPTLVQSGYLGADAGRALARVLFGDVNPSAKLAVTWPKRYADTPVAQRGTYAADRSIYNERFFVGYRWYDAGKIAPLFPFGYGLSYTTFTYSDVAVAPAGNGWTVTVRVANAGQVAGREIVQLYMRPVAPGVERPVKELKGFAKTRLLMPGESETLSFAVSPRDLAFFDVFYHRWRTLPGAYDLVVGASSADLRGEVRVTVAGDTVFGR